MEVFNPFAYIFANQVITEDLSELKECKIFASGREQQSKDDDYLAYHVLKSYKHSEQILLNYFNKFIKDNFDYDCDWEIGTSWITNLDKGQRVHPHLHRNYLWSGVFYFDEYTPQSCPLQFRNPIYETLPFMMGRTKSNTMTSDICVVPQHNLLILFPSWILHYSDINQEANRKSLAFNFKPKGGIGLADSTLFL